MSDSTDLRAQLSEQLRDNITFDNQGRPVGPGGTTLHNAHDGKAPITAWIDRRSKWGNPFVTEKDGGDYTRDESVELYRGWFYGHIETDEWEPEALRGETLGCWCVPKNCHGTVILNYLADTYNPQRSVDEF